MGGGLRRASVILNHQVPLDERAAVEAPRIFLNRLSRSLGFRPAATVALMTGANIKRGGFAITQRQELIVSAWCSAGCSNALRVGDRATAPSGYSGTINIVVAINCPVAPAVLVEIVQLAVEARVVAVQDARVMSVRSGLPATGTGTDCIVVAAPTVSSKRGTRVILYGGKHTLLGELAGRAVLKCCTTAIAHPQD